MAATNAPPGLKRADFTERDFSMEEKVSALELALRSATFSRSDQLRSFFRWICEKEIRGHTSEISEYVIGIEVFGLAEGYSISEDSRVRKRAYELRQKLEKLYSSELAQAEIRIEIPKGSYVPRFVPHVRPALPVGILPVSDFPNSVTVPKRSRAWVWAAPLLAAGMAAGFFLRPVISRTPTNANLPAITTEAWGPIAASGSDTVVCVATNLHLLVRPHPNPLNSVPKFPAFPELSGLFRQHRPLADGEPLAMEVADSSVTFGEVRAVAEVENALRSFHSNYQVLPERVAPLALLRNRNSVVIGVPMDSLVVSKLLSRCAYTIEYSERAGDQAILDRRKPASAPPIFSTERGMPNYVYGLISVLPSEDSLDGAKRTVVLSGLGSVGAHGAAQFFCSPANMEALRKKLKAQGFPRLPSAYQIVVKCKESENLLMSVEYAGHLVIQK